MAENDDLNLKSKLGVTRRDLLRRGAVVGGALLWIAPTIQSITPPAFAENTSPTVVSCCKCGGPNDPCVTNVTEDVCAQVCGGADRVRTYMLNATCGESHFGQSCVPLEDTTTDVPAAEAPAE